MVNVRKHHYTPLEALTLLVGSCYVGRFANHHRRNPTINWSYWKPGALVEHSSPELRQTLVNLTSDDMKNVRNEDAKLSVFTDNQWANQLCEFDRVVLRVGSLRYAGRL